MARFRPVAAIRPRRTASASDAGRIFIGVAHEVSADWNKIDRVDDRHWRFPACDINTLNIPVIVALNQEYFGADRTKDAMRIDTTDRNKADDRAKRLVTSGLHPRVYAAMIALSLWFVVWVWSFFSAGAGAGVAGYLLFIVSGFIGVVIALQLILSSVRRPTEIPNSNTAKDDTPSFQDWVRGYFDTEDGPLRSAEAATIILLPIAAAAVGMMIFGIEFQIVEHAGGA
jgi:hypothetical protein